MLNITRPTLILDEIKCKQNIRWMVEKSKRLGVDLVPHFKTHQSKEIGGWFREEGVDAITVSSVKMAQYFGTNGWNNITIAFPINVLEVDALNTLIGQGVNLKLLVVSLDTVKSLNDQLIGKAEILIEVDAGYNRTGIDVQRVDEIKKVASTIEKSDNLDFYGLYCHPGNTYQSNSIVDIRQIWEKAIAKIMQLKSQLVEEFPDLKIRMGDTPGCTVVENMDGIDEIGPGNFVFYDLVMNYLDVCTEDQIAVAVACPVVAKNSDRNQIVIHGGAVHFSKDHLFDRDENKFFGEVVVFEDEGWSSIIEGIKLSSISQEHGILTASEEVFQEINVGDIIGVLPIHSCLTVNLMKEYHTIGGKIIPHLESTA